MATLTALDPLVEELLAFDGKAEIVNGEIQEIMATGFDPGYAADEIYVSLRAHARATGDGVAFADGKGFLCDLPHRKSFSPDAAFYTGPRSGMGSMPEPPIFAVEVRSENDYGPTAERAIRAKIADYFAAGTLVVWDVDLQHDEVVAKYSATIAAGVSARRSRRRGARRCGLETQRGRVVRARVGTLLTRTQPVESSG